LRFLLYCFLYPKVPRWLVLRGKEQCARTTLQRINQSVDIVNKQIADIKEVISSETNTDWKLIFKPGILKAVIIGASIAILGQFMGVNAVLYYGPSIFEEAGLSGGDALYSQVLVGIVNMLTTIVAVLIIDKVGRKKLVYYGVSGMTLSLLLIGFYFHFHLAYELPNNFLLFFFCFMYFVAPSLFAQLFLSCCLKCTPRGFAD
jgi:Sugar (and other) transporter.